tara:strand:- start:376 stop:615 length:240 start_codon:yes stop_codon:yes gene_type:complete
MMKYKTSDLYFSAYLKTAGVRFVGTEKEGNKVFFIFEKTDMIRDLKREYFNRTARIPALSFVDEIRSMKSLTYMARQDD